MEEAQKTPGLRWRDGKPIWRASKPAVRAGYPVKSVNLASLAANPAAVIARAQRLHAEMLEWLSGRSDNAQPFDGTITSLIAIYQTDPDSPYHNLKPSSRHPYDVYARMLTAEIGTRRIDHCDGRDARRWFRAWSAPEKEGARPRIAAARMAMNVLKSAMAFGKTCRLRGCADFKAIMDELQFPAPEPRSEAPSAADVIKARKAAHELGHARAALAYAVQFETTLRQWDVIGEWVPLSDKRPSAIIDGKKKWIGPIWAQVDDNNVFRVTPSKTEDLSRIRVVYDLNACPMVMEELARIPIEERIGPLIINPRTALPYRQWYFRDFWRKVADRVGIRAQVWNRDLRAGGNTEGQKAGALLEDRKKITGHSMRSQQTAEVYDRDHIEAHRRVMRARRKLRENET